MSKTINFDFQKVCRTCLSTVNLKLLYDKSSSQAQDSWNEMLMICTSMEDSLLLKCNFQYYESDGLPVKICTNCIKKLNRSYQFALKCRDTDEKLRNYMLKLVPEEYAIPNSANINYGERSKPEKPRKDSLAITELQKVLNQTLKVPNIKVEPCQPDSLEINTLNNGLKLKPEQFQELQPDKTSFPVSNQNHRCQVGIKMGDNDPVDRLQTTNLAEQIEIFDKPFSCQMCQTSFIRKDNLIKHIMQIHAAENTLNTCTICSTSFKKHCNLLRHMRTHNDDKPYGCDVCESKFKEPGYLKIHMRTHNKQHICAICNSSYSHQQSLEQHMRKHTGDKLNPCTVCDRSFVWKTDLTRHMRTHTGEKPYTCTICDKSFKQQQHLQYHTQTHNRDNRYSCKICGQTFEIRTSLTLHKLTHTEEKKFDCTLCPSSYLTTVELNRHLRRHATGKQFTCVVCDTSFVWKSDLTRHMLTHAEKKKYKCSECESSFKRNDHLNNHVLKVHSGKHNNI